MHLYAIESAVHLQVRRMDIFAISDLHVGFKDNQRALAALRPRPDAALILAGDIGETAEQLASTLDLLRPRFRKLVWCPGNHELWQIGENALRGEAKYRQLVELMLPADCGQNRSIALYLLHFRAMRPPMVFPGTRMHQ